jgi:hypothetical protein
VRERERERGGGKRGEREKGESRKCFFLDIKGFERVVGM